MRRLFVLSALAFAAAAHATNKPAPAPAPSQAQDQLQGQTQGQSSFNTSSSSLNGSLSQSSAANLTGGSYDNGNFYVLPAPVAAAPLPANLCPKGDSLSWSIGWNFFSYATSSTRTELECLDKALQLIRAMTPPPAPAPMLAPLTPTEKKELERLEAPKLAPVVPAVVEAPPAPAPIPVVPATTTKPKKAAAAKKPGAAGCTA